MIHGTFIDEDAETAQLRARRARASGALADVARSVVEEIGACDIAGICLVTRGARPVHAARHASVELIDELQRALGEGPDLGRLRPDHVLAVSDLRESATGSAWASSAGIEARSFVGLPLVLADEVVGVLNLYAFAPDAFTASDVEAARVLAARAASSLVRPDAA